AWLGTPATRRINFAYVGDGSGAAGTAPWQWAERLAPGIGLLIAVAVCAGLGALRRSGRLVRLGRVAQQPAPGRTIGWLVVLLGVLGLLALEPVRVDAATAAADALSQLGLAACAGVVLGGAAEAARGRRWTTELLVGGAVAACIVAQPAA